MVFKKISQTHFSNGGEPLVSKDFLKHDILHRAVDRMLGIENEWLNSHTAEIEMITGMLHNVYSDDFAYERLKEGAENMFSSLGKPVPAYLTQEFVDEVRNLARKTFERYRNLKTGESLEI